MVARAKGAHPIVAPMINFAATDDAPAYDPREADRLRRGGYVPGARAHYVGGSPDGEQPSQGLGRGMFAVGGDEPGAGSGNAGMSASGGNAALLAEAGSA